MTDKQQMKMELLEKYANPSDVNSIGFCREAYKFINEDGGEGVLKNPESSTLPDGVYAIYENGDILPFTGENKREGIKNVGFKFGNIALKLHPKNIKDVTLTSEKGGEKFISNRHEAVMDFAGKENTRALVARGLGFELQEGYYIPALGELCIMYIMMAKLNGALCYFGMDELEEDWYWSSTEGSATYAWNKYLNGGGVNFNTKAANTGYVRAVTALV